MEGENGPAPLSPSSSSSPSPPLAGEDSGGPKPLRRLGRQESPLSKETLCTVREKDNRNVASGPSRSQTDSKDCKSNTVDSSRPETCEIKKAAAITADGKVESSPAPDQSIEVATVPDRPKLQIVAKSRATPEVSSTKSVVSGENTAQQQESRQQRVQQDKTQEKAAESSRSSLGKGRSCTEKESQEQNKPRKGSADGQKFSSSSSGETTKVKGAAAQVPKLAQSQTASAATAAAAAAAVATPAARSKVERASNSNRRSKEEKVCRRDFFILCQLAS